MSSQDRHLVFNDLQVRGVMTPTLRIKIIASISILPVSLHNFYPFTFFFSFLPDINMMWRSNAPKCFSLKASKLQQSTCSYLKEHNLYRKLKTLFLTRVHRRHVYVCSFVPQGSNLQIMCKQFRLFLKLLNSCSFCEFPVRVGCSAAADVAMATWTHSRRRSVISSSFRTRFII